MYLSELRKSIDGNCYNDRNTVIRISTCAGAMVASG